MSEHDWKSAWHARSSSSSSSSICTILPLPPYEAAVPTLVLLKNSLPAHTSACYTLASSSHLTHSTASFSTFPSLQFSPVSAPAAHLRQSAALC